ncbi:hypothetical protein A3K93_07265 [Acinetobacter sp. NCu2D-2]|uniref:hypothetical protein n=1 Tax=Acinetobacter sp. NCu2D-2 TaxID=1608473 RepID=UPI0007CDA6E6|nr:hypothetical protein [Acinetobacter sp. NCu2D-2]ANF82016.1 hypothetical protein A3K93_07265 [Acinetobacter sp. NCu2D-2]
MHYQYHCACCNKVVSSMDKECTNCGSHNIRSPYGFWIFCIIACLIAVVAIKGIQAYVQSHNNEVPEQHTLLDVLDHKNPK